jgi:hypothetical protein
VNINLIVPTNKRMQNKELKNKGKHLNCKNSSKKNGKKTKPRTQIQNINQGTKFKTGKN